MDATEGSPLTPTLTLPLPLPLTIALTLTLTLWKDRLLVAVVDSEARGQATGGTAEKDGSVKLAVFCQRLAEASRHAA